MTTQLFRKYPLPRVLLHGQTDTTEAEDRHFFMEVVDKSVHDAISSHNEAFVDVFHNAMREAIHGVLVGQGGPVWGVRPRIPTADHMGCAPRGGPAHKMKPCGARFCSAPPARHGEDILKMLRDLLGYVHPMILVICYYFTIISQI